MTVPLYNLTDTWTDGGTIYTAIKMNVTNTASAAGSMLMDLQVGGQSTFQVDNVGALRLTGATVTTSNPILNITQTWNAGGVTFTGLKLNITATAAAADSRLVDIQLGGTSFFALQRDARFSSALNLAQPGSDIVIGANNTSVTFGGFNVSTNNASIGIGGMIVRSTGAYSWSSSSLDPWQAGGDTFLNRDAANIIAQRNGTNVQTLRIYNTFTDASNYERGVFDWGTTSNTLTIGTQAAGTGTARNVTLLSAGNGVISLAKTAGSLDGWIQWGGQARVTSDFSVTSSTALTNVTGLSVAVQAGRSYSFEAELYVTDAAAGGVQAAIAGTATATAIQYTGYTIADNAIKGKTNATALATAVGSTVTTETAGIVVRITGTITVNAAGTLTVQMAQNTSNGTATIAKRGSYFIVQDMP
jgi:hypothetical protein